MTKIPSKARAAVLVEYGKPLEIREYPIPDIGPGAILVRNEMAGVCGTDVHQWHGMYQQLQLPLIMGHETVGRIVKLGEGREHDCTGESLKVGDRILAAHAPCGECYWCVIDHKQNLCAGRMVYGFGPCDSDPHFLGGFAEYSYIFPGSQVVKVPEEVTTEEVAGVSCAFSIVMHAYDRLGSIRHQDNVVILGAGPVGLYSLLLAKEAGAGMTVVIGAPRERLQLATRWGADHTINIDDKPDSALRQAAVLELTNGIGADVVVECAGTPDAFAEGLAMARCGGRYLVIGQTSGSAVSIVPTMIVIQELDVIGSMSADIGDYQRAIQFISRNRSKYPLADIVSGKYPLERAGDALIAMETGREIKPVIVP